MRLPIEKLRMTKEELIATVLTAALVGAFEKIGEKIVMGIFWFVLASLKLANNRLLMPMVRRGEKLIKGRLVSTYKEPIKPVVNKSSGGFFCFGNNDSLFWALQCYTVPPHGDFEEKEPGKDEYTQKETKPGEQNSQEQKDEE